MPNDFDQFFQGNRRRRDSSSCRCGWNRRNDWNNNRRDDWNDDNRDDWRDDRRDRHDDRRDRHDDNWPWR